MDSLDKHNTQVSQALARLRIRKTPSAVLSQYVASLLENSDSPDREDLIRLISLDPLMVLWILKRANSSYYGLRSTVDSISRAIDVLDDRSVAGMFVETFGVQEATEPTFPSHPPEDLTRHSVATAILSATLDCGDPLSRGLAFTAGLLHDIGKHVFALNYPDEAAKIFSASSLWESLQGSDLVAVEQLAFGLDHREVGEYVTRKMHFPENLTEAVKYHASPHSLPATHPAYRISWIVNVASLAATALGYAAGESVSWEQCMVDSRWSTLIDGKLTPWPSVEALHSACSNGVDAIDEFLNFEVDRSKSLMKMENRTKRMSREPVPGDRTTDRAPGNWDEHKQA